MGLQNPLNQIKFRRLVLAGVIVLGLVLAWRLFGTSTTSTITFGGESDESSVGGGTGGGDDVIEPRSLFDVLDFSFIDIDKRSASTASQFSGAQSSVIANVADSIPTEPVPDTSIDSSDTLSREQVDAVVEYLVASSDIAYPIPRDVSFAILRHREGSGEDLLELIKTFRAKQEALIALEPPAILEQYHENSYNVVQEYVGLLVRISAQSTKDNIDIILTSGEANRIRTEGRALYDEIKTFTTEHGITLPQDVLPD